MARLPVPGSDQGDWGDILNTFLSVSLSSSGEIKSSAIASAGGQLASAKGQAGGYASLDNSGVIPAAQLPTMLDGVGDYVGVGGGFTAADNTAVLIDWANTTATRGSSLSWSDNTPNRVDVVTTGVYAVTAMVQWGDHVAVSPGVRSINIFASCGFYVVDRREYVGSGTETHQSANYTVYMQAGSSFRLYATQEGEPELNPYAMMLVTRVA